MALPFIPVTDNRMRKKTRVFLNNLTQVEIRKHCGVNTRDCDLLFDLLEPLVIHPTKRNNAVSAQTQVLIALSAFRSGTFQYVEGTAFGVSQSTVSRILNTMSDSIVKNLLAKYIKFPNNVQHLNYDKSKFYDLAGFPNTVGVIDGTRIIIKSPKIDEFMYVDKKKNHSINCQVVCNWDNSFKNIVVKWPGSTHDSFIWNQSTLRDRFQAGDFGISWLLGDSGYGCEPWLLTPFRNPHTPAEKLFNSKFKSTRSIIERSIGIWKSRWRCIDQSGGKICYEPPRACKIIAATAVLHNFCVEHRIELLEEDHEHLLRRFLHNTDFDMEYGQDESSGVLVRDQAVATYFNR